MTLQEPKSSPSVDLDNPDTHVLTAPLVAAPVFVDATGRRRRLLRRASYAFGALTMLYGGLVSVSLAGGPVSPNAVLPLQALADGGDAGGDVDAIEARPTPIPQPSTSTSAAVKTTLTTNSEPRRTYSPPRTAERAAAPRPPIVERTTVPSKSAPASIAPTTKPTASPTPSTPSPSASASTPTVAPPKPPTTTATSPTGSGGKGGGEVTDGEIIDSPVPSSTSTASVAPRNDDSDDSDYFDSTGGDASGGSDGDESTSDGEGSGGQGGGSGTDYIPAPTVAPDPADSIDYEPTATDDSPEPWLTATSPAEPSVTETTENESTGDESMDDESAGNESTEDEPEPARTAVSPSAAPVRTSRSEPFVSGCPEEPA